MCKRLKKISQSALRRKDIKEYEAYKKLDS